MEVEVEIQKLSGTKKLEPLEDQISKRDHLQKLLKQTRNEDEKARLKEQLREVDEAVKDSLSTSAKASDDRLKARLEARRKKREAQLKNESSLKKEQL